MPTLFGKGEGNNQRTALARDVGIPRGRRPQQAGKQLAREPGAPVAIQVGTLGRIEKSRTDGDDERTQKSDRPIVATKRANKVGATAANAAEPMAERVERRGLAKGNRDSKHEPGPG